MSVTKKSLGSSSQLREDLTLPPPPVPSRPLHRGTAGDCHIFVTNDFTRKIIWTLFAIVLVYVIVFVGTLIRNNMAEYNRIGMADRSERFISLDAVGVVAAVPDIATIRMGMMTEAPTVQEAQKTNDTTIRNLVEQLTALGIEKKDIKTDQYTVYPVYEFSDSANATIRGYEVSQQVSVKVRNLDLTSKVVSLAGTVGLNIVSGPEFTIDDKEVYLAEARQQAMDMVLTKAKAIESSLGVRFLGVSSYYEYEEGNGMMPYAYDIAETKEMPVGYSSSPIEAGTSEIRLTINVSFEIQ